MQLHVMSIDCRWRWRHATDKIVIFNCRRHDVTRSRDSSKWLTAGSRKIVNDIGDSCCDSFRASRIFENTPLNKHKTFGAKIFARCCIITFYVLGHFNHTPYTYIHGRNPFGQRSSRRTKYYRSIFAVLWSVLWTLVLDRLAGMDMEQTFIFHVLIDWLSSGC